MSDPQNAPSGPPTSKEELERQKLQIELEISKKQLAALGKTPPAPHKPWWTVAVDFLGLPLAVVGLAVAFTQASGNHASEQKTIAETEQIRAGLASATQTSKLASDLSQKEKEGPKAFEQAVALNADKIQDALSRLQELEEQSARVTIQRSVLKFVLLWILFTIVSLVFDMIGTIWTAATNAVFYAMLKLFPNSFGDNPSSFVRNFLPVILMINGQIPTVLKWAIQLSIFAALLAPLFNEIAASFGSNVHFADVMMEARHLRFGSMLSTMKQLLFG
jgi:hypothetical protein